MLASAASASAGSGCSISATPASAQQRIIAARSVSAQLSLASTISVVLGAAARTAAMRSRSPAPPSLTLSSGRAAAFTVAAAISSGVPTEIVYAVTVDLGRARAGAAPDGHAALLRLEVPERAVQGVARRAGWQQVLQAGAVRSLLDGRPHAVDGGDDAGGALAVAGIRHAFATARARPSEIVATTTCASVFAPRAMTNRPAIGKVSIAQETCAEGDARVIAAA